MAEPSPGGKDESWEYSQRKYLLLLATLGATVTYHAGFNLPGGVWQTADPASHRIAGDPIIREMNHARYRAFSYCNATAFASSLVVIVLVLSGGITRTRLLASPLGVVLQTAMLLDLVGLMGAYAAGAFRDTLTAVYSLVLSAGVVGYLVAHWVLASKSPAPAEGKLKKGKSAPERLRKVLMLLATFAASATYVAGLSAPGGFWDHAEDDHHPGEAILKGGTHDARLKAFVVFNTTAFVASLLILVMLLEKKLCFSEKVRSFEIYGFIAATLISLLAAYAAGSSRQIDTTIYVSALVGAVAVYILIHVVLVLLIQQRNSSGEQQANGNGSTQGPQTSSDNSSRVVNFWRAHMHRRDGRLVKCGPHEWVLDSGTQNHHTSNLELLLDFQFREMDNDDASAPHVEGHGSVRTECFDFPGVHYVVGDDTRNVVSVSQLARDHGLVTIFEPTCCQVKDKKTGQIVGKGRLRNGMYILDSLRIVGQYIGDRGASGGSERDDGEGGARGHGEQGNNGEEGDSGMTEGRGGGGQNRDGRGGRAGPSSGSGAAGGDLNDDEIVNQEDGSSGNEIQEMNDEKIDQDDIGKTHQEINGNGEDEDKKRGHSGGGSTFGESSNNKASIGLSRLAVIVLCWCIAACISVLQCTSTRTGGTILPMDFSSLLGLSLLFILSFQPLIPSSLSMDMLLKQIGSLFRGRSTKGTTGDYYVQESPQEYNRRLFGLSRYDVTTDPTGNGRRQLPAGAFPSSTNTARREEFLVDSGASFHATWNGQILVSYENDLKDHTEPPTRYFRGIIGSIAVERSGYLSFGNIKLDGVLLAPDSRMNLVSVGQLAVQYKVQVEMDDEGFIIKKKQDGEQIGGGKMLNNHQYVLEYFQPVGYLFALRRTPGFKIFGARRPGRPQVNTDPCPARSTTTEETVGPSADQQGPTESSSLGEHRSRKLNPRYFGSLWSNS